MKTTSGQDALTTRPAPEPRIAKVKGQAVCPKGHRAPRVQYLADEEVYCCITCAVTWKAIFEITIPAGMSVEKWAQMALAAPELFEALKTLRALIEDQVKSNRRWVPQEQVALEIARAAIVKVGGQ